MVQEIEYVIVIHPADEGGFWSGVVSLPGAGSQGESVDEAVTNTRESIEAVLEVMKVRGEPPRTYNLEPRTYNLEPTTYNL